MIRNLEPTDRFSSRRLQRRARGFTLIELLITIAVAAILVTVGIPGFVQTVRDNRRHTLVNEYLATLHLARSEAINRNLRVTVCPSELGTVCGGGWQDGWIAFVDRDGDGAVDDGEQLLQISEAAEGFSIESSDYGGFISYRPNGKVMTDDIRDTSGEFVFCDDRGALHARVVIVDPSGRPRASTHTMLGEAPSC